ncbi:hypothetical protein EUX98_g7205 [Antrodiella citrinella]|uniref:Uncharacterized protein n=1 Tax=Antrodiella citrinella TaxID=2447956 RepID=A0A4S4MMD7_9APHY|nr:hypothetical protein EUX98_g7205 [Antrodiella citrinella]
MTPSTSRVKPLSMASAGPHSPHGSVDDGASEAGTRPRQRKSEADRIQFFNDDPNCADLSPYRALCTKCQKVIVLSTNRRYVMKNWAIHRKSDCAIVPDEAGLTSPKPAVQSSAEAKEIATEPSLLVPPAPSASSVKFPTVVGSETIKEEAQLSKQDKRKARLEADPLAETVEAHAVLCRSCHQWIQLAATTRYATAKWVDHREYQCPAKGKQEQPSVGPSDPTPGPTDSTSVAETKQEEDSDVDSDADSESHEAVYSPAKLLCLLRADPQLVFLPGEDIRCRYCSKVYPTAGNLQVAYNDWQQHKETCHTPRRESRLSSFTFWLPSFLSPSVQAETSPNPPADTPIVPDKGASPPSGWLANMWPYGRRSSSESNLPNGATPSSSRSVSGPSSLTSRKRGREEDEEGEAKQVGRVVRPRRTEPAGLWRRLSASVVGLVDGVKAGYAAAASSSSMDGVERMG